MIDYDDLDIDSLASARSILDDGWDMLKKQQEIYNFIEIWKCALVEAGYKQFKIRYERKKKCLEQSGQQSEL